MLALLAILLSTSPAQANYWNFDDLTSQDFKEMESIYIHQRMEDAKKLRAKVLAFARKNGGLKEMEEWSEDGLEDAPTNIDFTTHSGLNCLAATYDNDFKCIKLK